MINKKLFFISFLFLIFILPSAFAGYYNISNLILKDDFNYLGSTYASQGWTFERPSSNTPDNPVVSVFGNGGFGNNGSTAGAYNEYGTKIYRSVSTISQSESALIIFNVSFNKTNRPSPAFSVRVGNWTTLATTGYNHIRIQTAETEGNKNFIEVECTTCQGSYQKGYCDFSDFVQKSGIGDGDYANTTGVEIAVMLDFIRDKYWVYADGSPLGNCSNLNLGTIDSPNWEIKAFAIGTPYGPSFVNTTIDNVILAKGFLTDVGPSTSTSNENITDLYEATESIFDDFGLETDRSKYMLGVFLLVFMVLVFVGFGLSRGQMISGGLIAVLSFIFSVLLVYMGLLPTWLLWIYGIMAILGMIGMLYIKAQN